MKLGVVIPLKSKLVAKDWELTCENLRRTLNCIAHQTAPGLATVIVGHEEPKFLREYLEKFPDIHFIELKEIPPPSTVPDIAENQLLYEKDRCSKILKGINFLRKKIGKIEYWYALDADDLIHRDFVRKLDGINNFDAVVLNRGYIYYANSAAFNRENEFSAYCGSSVIVSDKLLPEDTKITQSSYKKFIFGEVSHVHMSSYLHAKGCHIFVPRDRLVVYYKDHGENISDETISNTITRRLKKHLKVIIKKIYFDQGLRSDFCIDSEAPSTPGA